MARNVNAVYSGTFDPLTLGHEDVVRRAALMFDQVVLAVATAHHKNTLFTLEQRLEQARAALADCPNVRVLPFEGLIVDFVRQQGAQVIVRGLRSVTDYDYETQMAGMNRHLAPQVDTVFLHTSAQVQHISSTLVREIASSAAMCRAWSRRLWCRHSRLAWPEPGSEVLRGLDHKAHALLALPFVGVQAVGQMGLPGQRFAAVKPDAIDQLPLMAQLDRQMLFPHQAL